MRRSFTKIRTMYKVYKRLSDSQVQLIKDCESNFGLERTVGTDLFQFDANRYHGSSVGPLVKKNILIAVEKTNAGYPLKIIVNQHHKLVQAIGYVNDVITIKGEGNIKIIVEAIGYNEATDTVYLITPTSRGRGRAIEINQVKK